MYYLQKFTLKGIFGYGGWIIYYDKFWKTCFQEVGFDGTDISEDIDSEFRVHIKSTVPTGTNFIVISMYEQKPKGVWIMHKCGKYKAVYCINLKILLTTCIKHILSSNKLHQYTLTLFLCHEVSHDMIMLHWTYFSVIEVSHDTILLHWPYFSVMKWVMVWYCYTDLISLSWSESWYDNVALTLFLCHEVSRDMIMLHWPYFSHEVSHDTIMLHWPYFSVVKWVMIWYC